MGETAAHLQVAALASRWWEFHMGVGNFKLNPKLEKDPTDVCGKDGGGKNTTQPEGAEKKVTTVVHVATWV